MIPIQPHSPATQTVALFSQPGQINITTQLPLSLYIHWPWCVKKCPYCDFNSHESNNNVPEQAYLTALIADLESALPLVWGRRVQTVFIGGGTPSLMSASTLDELLAAVRARLPLEPDAEVTLEANPGTFEVEKFRAFKASGINRLSLGIQSFNSKHLKALGRIHDGQEAQRAAAFAAEVFDNFNLDLMFALPEQTLAECEADVRLALTFAPPHLSLYHLTIEPNTLFHRYPPLVPDDDTAFAMQDLITQQLDLAGYQHYEVSAYAKPGHRARHNMNYWRFGDYLGIGAGAHSKLSFPHRIIRQMRHKQPAAYLQAMQKGNAIHEEHEISHHDLPFEFMLNAMRLTEGVALADWEARTGLPITYLQAGLAKAEARGLIERNHQQMKPTVLGQQFLNDLQMLFLRE